MVANRRFRLAIAVGTIFMPWSLKRRLLSWLLGYNLSPSARIGYSVVSVSSFTLGQHASVGHLNVCRGLARLEVRDYARIGNLNWITADEANPLPHADSGEPVEMVLIIGEHSAVTNRHYLDCLGGIEIGAFTTVAGIRSQMLTHSIGLQSNRQQVKPISIGDYCFVGTGCIILRGSRLPNRSVLGAGSLLRSAFEQEWTLYAGVPATPQKEIPRDSQYFHREKGFVD